MACCLAQMSLEAISDGPDDCTMPMRLFLYTLGCINDSLCLSTVAGRRTCVLYTYGKSIAVPEWHESKIAVKRTPW